MDNNITNLNSYNFEAVWNGMASDAQQEEFQTLKKQLVKCNDDVKLFEESLELKSKYEEICAEIARISAELASCPCRNRPEDGSCSSCSAKSDKLQTLAQEKETVYNQIRNILIKFNVEMLPYQDFVLYELANIQPEIEGLNFPLFNQNDFDQPYGNGTIATSGCGITCAAMIISAYTGQTVTPDMLAETIKWDGNDTTLNRALNAYGIKNANNNFLIETSTSKYEYIDGGFTEFDSSFMNYYEIKDKIEDGYIAVFQMNQGTFTNGEHFILVTGVNEDGNLIVQDPNGNNYVATGTERSNKLQNGFENGFTDSDFLTNGQWSGCYLVEPYESYRSRTDYLG